MSKTCSVHGGEHRLLVDNPDRKRPLTGSKRTMGVNNIRQAKYVQRNIGARLCNFCCISTAIHITHYGCVCVCVCVGSFRYPMCNARSPYCDLWRARFYDKKVKVKQSHYRPEQALRFPGG
jgi:hypothetical protein